MAKINLSRALTARIANRFVRLATYITVGIFGIVFVACALLAYFFSGWWWLVIVPFVILFVLFIFIRLMVLLIIRRIHSERLTQEQSEAMDDFVSKLEALIEARATPPWVFVAISLKDILLHRDVTTIKKIISDTASLRSDYRVLEKLF